MIPKIDWPEGKDFGFTIFDDPDGDSVETVDVVYSFLRDLGLRMTKAVCLSKDTARQRWVGLCVKPTFPNTVSSHLHS